MNPAANCDTDQDEYWYHVAAQHEMPLAGNARPPLTLNWLDELHPEPSDYAPGSITEGEVAKALLKNPKIAEEMRSVLSLSDKRFYLDISYLFSRTTISAGGDQTICGCLPNKMKKHATSMLLNILARGNENERNRAAEVIADYFIEKNLLTVLDLYYALSREQRLAINDVWLSPKNAQQNESKRRGHGAEAEIARVLVDSGVNIYPPDKATNPMGAHDPNVSRTTFELTRRVPGETISVDIAVLNSENQLAAMVASLVQSSDPGQFGVDKAATNRDIRRKLDEFRLSTRSAIELWGIVDGIGYAENPAGTVNPMLESFHCFIQLKSAYKSILRAGTLGLIRPVAIMYDMGFYTPMTRGQMHARYAGGLEMVERLEDAPRDLHAVQAGRATVWLS